MTDRKTLSHMTVEGLLAEVFDMTLDGWTISDDERGEMAMFGGAYAVTMVRSDASVRTLKERADAVGDRPKKTPQERAAYARAQIGKAALKLEEVVKP